MTEAIPHEATTFERFTMGVSVLSHVSMDAVN